MSGAQTGSALYQAPAVLGPLKGSVLVQSVTSGATVHFDLSSGFGTQYPRRMISITSGEPMGFLFSDGATDACDLTAVAGDTRCDRLAGNERRECYPMGRYLHVIAASTTDYVRVSIASP